MTPFHPKFRESLLEHPEHRRNAVLILSEELLEKLKTDKVLKFDSDKLDQIKKQGIRRDKKILNMLKAQNIEDKSEKTSEKSIHPYRLTSDKLFEYEVLTTRWFKIEEKDRGKDITHFLETYMPKFEKIHKNWVKRQKRVIDDRYYELSPLKIIKNSIILFGLWLGNPIIKMWYWILTIYYKRKDNSSLKKLSKI